MPDGNTIAHLEVIRQDIRDEIKRRIEQRDKFSIQLTFSLGAIVAVSFSTTGFGKVLIAAPLVSIYFTMLIIYSYRLHDLLAAYLREEIEPKLARLCGTSLEIEWETYYKDKKHEKPGMRRAFFLFALWVVCIGSLVYLWLAERDQPGFKVVLIVVTVIYIVVPIVITCQGKPKG